MGRAGASLKGFSGGEIREVAMLSLHPDCPADVSLLADHLDAALAIGEELLGSVLPARSDLDEQDPEQAPAAIEDFIHRLMQLEAAFLLRVLRARRLTAAIGRGDAALRASIGLFRAQTDLLQELIVKAANGPEGQLTRTGDSHAYLRSRALIAPEAAALSPFESITVGEGFRIGGVAEVGHILNFVSSLLDLLDAHYGLYSPDDEEEGAIADDPAPAIESLPPGSAPPEPPSGGGQGEGD